MIRSKKRGGGGVGVIVGGRKKKKIVYWCGFGFFSIPEPDPVYFGGCSAMWKTDPNCYDKHWIFL